MLRTASLGCAIVFAALHIWVTEDVYSQSLIKRRVKIIIYMFTP